MAVGVRSGLAIKSSYIKLGVSQFTHSFECALTTQNIRWSKFKDSNFHLGVF